MGNMLTQRSITIKPSSLSVASCACPLLHSLHTFLISLHFLIFIFPFSGISSPFLYYCQCFLSFKPCFSCLLSGWVYPDGKRETWIQHGAGTADKAFFLSTAFLHLPCLFHLVPVPSGPSGTRHVIMAQTWCGALTCWPGQFHTLPRRVDCGG